MIATALTCTRCRVRTHPECPRCDGTGVEPEPVLIDRERPVVHAYAVDNAARRILGVLLCGPRRTGVDYVARDLATALSCNTHEDRAFLVIIAERFMLHESGELMSNARDSTRADRCVTAFVNALEETASNFRDAARRADGADRRDRERDARELEAIVKRMEET